MMDNVSYDFLEQNIAARFEIWKVLKNSPDSRIILCRHRESGRLFVVRRVSGKVSVYRRLMEISCPALPRVYEAVARNGSLLVLEEYIQGDSLEMLLEGGLFSEKQTRRIAAQVCEGLWVLHRMDAVHRDVKLSNVLLRSDRDQAVLIDFDASRIFKPDQDTDTVVLGTPGYAAPEQYGMSQTDGRADIYALGVMMNFMLTGEHPSRILASGRMGRIIRKCTMMSPNQRYPDVRHLMEAL